MAQRRLIWNPPVGHDNGDEFKAVQADSQGYVSGIEVFTHESAGGDDDDSIKAINIIWSNGDTETYGQADGDATTFEFEKSDRIKRFIIYAKDSINAIYLESERNPGGWRAGGSGGNAYEQDVGDGVLVGFWGRAGAGIYKLGAIFGAGGKSSLLSVSV